MFRIPVWLHCQAVNEADMEELVKTNNIRSGGSRPSQQSQAQQSKGFVILLRCADLPTSKAQPQEPKFEPVGLANLTL